MVSYEFVLLILNNYNIVIEPTDEYCYGVNIGSYDHQITYASGEFTNGTRFISGPVTVCLTMEHLILCAMKDSMLLLLPYCVSIKATMELLIPDLSLDLNLTLVLAPVLMPSIILAVQVITSVLTVVLTKLVKVGVVCMVDVLSSHVSQEVCTCI